MAGARAESYWEGEAQEGERMMGGSRAWQEKQNRR